MSADEDHSNERHVLLSAEQVADELGVSTRALRAWRRRGVGPRWTEVEGRPAYRPADVAAWLAKAASKPTVSPLASARQTPGRR